MQNNFNVMMQNGLSFEEALKNSKEGRVIIPPKKEEKSILGGDSNEYSDY